MTQVYISVFLPLTEIIPSFANWPGLFWGAWVKSRDYYKNSDSTQWPRTSVSLFRSLLHKAHMSWGRKNGRWKSLRREWWPHIIQYAWLPLSTPAQSDLMDHSKLPSLSMWVFLSGSSLVSYILTLNLATQVSRSHIDVSFLLFSFKRFPKGQERTIQKVLRV